MMAPARDTSINILMYHSISDGAGPTCIPVDIFAAQLATIEACGYAAVSLADVAAWHAGNKELPARAVVITFDDGFADFADNAFPKLAARGWPSTVFLPTGKVGAHADWDGEAARPLLTWERVKELAEQGVEFGGHSVGHVDLTSLSTADMQHQVRQSHDDIEQNLGCAPTCFAAPFGQTNSSVRDAIAQTFKIAVGTHLNRANRRSDLFDLPRIEMHYFRDIARWRAYLNGSDFYFGVRKVLRSVKARVT